MIYMVYYFHKCAKMAAKIELNEKKPCVYRTRFLNYQCKNRLDCFATGFPDQVILSRKSEKSKKFANWTYPCYSLTNTTVLEPVFPDNFKKYLPAGKLLIST